MSVRNFWIGIACVLAVIVAVGVGINAANSGHHRPEGAAEHWLAAVSDTTRKGVHDDAVKRAEKIGPVSIAEPLLAGVNAHKKEAFPDLEVGKASVSDDVARVPYRLHVRDQDAPRSGTILLRKAEGNWHVFQLAGVEGKVPSEGGSPPSSVPGAFWVGGVLISLLLTVVATILVKWAGRSSQVNTPAT